MAPAPANDRKRVKVYELKNNDWYDRGTGFCAGQIFSSQDAEHLDARIIVTSEDDPDRTLLETRISKDDVYQKQQETLIVWTDPTGVDMALSFQEAEGCAGVWEFVSDAQSRIVPEESISDDLLDSAVPNVALPEPQLGRLEEVEEAIRLAAATPGGRDALVKHIMNIEQPYIMKLAPLVHMAEERESTHDLHRLCSIMKLLILLNDNSIIEFAVTDQAIMGVVGALEYDPDFPLHRAHHRKFLSDTSHFKEVVKIEQEEIRKKIHHTYRLQYLKDVVLARILDDPTFSVLNSVIFFLQVEIVNFLHSDPNFLMELFAVFADDQKDLNRKKEGVLFIQNCCAVSKNIQAQTRGVLYQNFVTHGIFPIITFALKHCDTRVRVAGTDILVSLIDHDAQMVRNHIFSTLHDRGPKLTDTLIDLLLVEVDLGVKTHMADAIRILLDPSSNNIGMEMMSRGASAEFVAKQRGGPGQPGHQISPQMEAYISSFYEDGAKRLFQPLKDLEHRRSMADLSVPETTLYGHLVEMLSFFVRQHSYRSKLFILSENLHARIGQLLSCPQKFVKLIALKWFRICVTLHDEFHNRQLIQFRLFEPILDVVYETMPKDNLLNSACLDLFEHIGREESKQLVVHLAEQYRERLMDISYVNTFQTIVQKYDQYQAQINGDADNSFTTEPDTPDALNRSRMPNGRQVYSGLKEPTPEEYAYFNADDDVEGDMDEDEDAGLPTVSPIVVKSASPKNGQITPNRPLVDYPDEDEDDTSGGHLLASSPDSIKEKKSTSNTDSAVTENEEERGRNRNPVPITGSPGMRLTPPESSLAVKRRRDEVDEDEDEDGNELGKHKGGTKRRHSSTSVSSGSSKIAAGNLRKYNANQGIPADDSAADTGDSDELIASDEFDEPSSNPTSAPTRDEGGAAAAATPHTLRRRANMKVKNEGTAHNPGRYAIKPVQPSSATAAKTHEAENGNTDTGG